MREDDEMIQYNINKLMEEISNVKKIFSMKNSPNRFCAREIRKFRAENISALRV